MMLNTRLILIEGLPGAGKTTTTGYLWSALQLAGTACRQYLEEDRPHPIDVTDFETKGLADKVVPIWQSFVEGALHEPTITIIDCRLWQNTALFMYMFERILDEIIEFNRRVSQAIRPLSPVLVYLDQEDTEYALRRLSIQRGIEWVDKAMSWTTQYPWFRSRGLNDFVGWVQFFEEWRQVAQRLYADWPGQKLKILNPHADWDYSYQTLKVFLQLEDASLKAA